MRDIKKYVHQNFGYDVEDLGSYVDEQSNEIFTNLVKAAPTMGLITVQDGIKSDRKIKIMNFDLPLQSGDDNCVRNNDGSVIFTDKEINDKQLKVEFTLCNKNLIGTWAQLGLAAGQRAQNEAIPTLFADKLLGHVVEIAKRKSEKLIWQGDTDSMNPDLAHFNGFDKLFAASTATTEMNESESVTAFTNSNSMTAIIAVADAIPEEVLNAEGGASVFVSPSVYRMALRQLYNEDKTHYDLQLNRDFTFDVPGTGGMVKVYAVGKGANSIIAGPAKGLVAGVDTITDVDGIKAQYEKGQIEIDVYWSLGVNKVFDNQFVMFTLPTEE